jgi:hypothetical protein
MLSWNPKASSASWRCTWRGLKGEALKLCEARLLGAQHRSGLHAHAAAVESFATRPHRQRMRVRAEPAQQQLPTVYSAVSIQLLKPGFPRATVSVTERASLPGV